MLTPIYELNGSFGLDGGDSGVGVTGDDVTSVEQSTRHVFALTGVTFDHLVVGFEARHGHLGDAVAFVERLVGADDGRVGGQGEMNTGERHQVGLELVEIDVETTIETQGGGDGGDDLSNQTVQVGESGGLDA